MIPYTPKTNHGRTVGGHDIFHKTADQSKYLAKQSAKVARKAARRQGQQDCKDGDLL